MGNDVLVDSNVYIDLLRAKRDVVAELYEWGRRRNSNLLICGMIRLEVLRGLTPPRIRSGIVAMMDVMINVPTDKRRWMEASELGWRMDRQGIMIPGPDLVIAACALRAGAAVMTSDAHFSRVPGLAVIAPPAEWLG